MDRRNFLKTAALTGLAVTAPVVTRDVGAATPYGGPFAIIVHAGGGWDPRFMFDPTTNPEQNLITTVVKQVGNIKVPDIPVDTDVIGLAAETAPYLMSAEGFATKFGGQLRVINGVDTSTNNHDAGARTMGCGRIAEGYPALGALMAAAKAPEKPMAFISAGGYDSTMNLVPLTRVSSASTLRKIAFPNAIDPNNLDGDKYHTDETATRIAMMQSERIKALQGGQHLPRIQRSMDELHLARLSENELANLKLPDTQVDLPNGLNDLENLCRKAQLAIAAFKSGLAVAANLSLGGFDTHGNHDTNQRRQVQKFLGGINYIMDELSAQGLGGQVTVIATSDFGRTPRYNDGDGKDHWSITSTFALGAGIVGNTTIGATKEADQKPLNVDPGNLSTLDNDKDGLRIRPEHVHRALRAKLGATEPGTAFPLPGDDVPLFG